MEKQIEEYKDTLGTLNVLRNAIEFIKKLRNNVDATDEFLSAYRDTLKSIGNHIIDEHNRIRKESDEKFGDIMSMHVSDSEVNRRMYERSADVITMIKATEVTPLPEDSEGYVMGINTAFDHVVEALETGRKKLKEKIKLEVH